MNKTYNILLVEDDFRLAQLVSVFLNNNGFHVAVENLGERVASHVKRAQPDLVILDIGLPDRDGFSVCKELRAFYDRPILILTAKDSDIDQVLGLEIGADDYVVKPTEPRVLLARIRALLRRAQTPADTLTDIRLGQLVINRRSRKVNLSNELVKLSSHEFDLLATLSSRAGEVFSRHKLYQQLYGRDYDGLDRTLDVKISRLRKKLGDDTSHPTKIKTVWGQGYLLVPDAW